MNTNTSESRKDPRIKLSRYVGIYDNSSNKLVGHIANLSKSGLMISGHNEFCKGKVFTFCTKNEFDEQLSFEAISRWCEKDEDNFNNTGFEFTQLPQKTEATFARYL